ncbi:hypothetical protein BWQ96_08913 [Gracilariopsis chorda]|uniref:Uncharacterized protein n=1 Tax=Gracilariopsis chorda TaxID=448386 RepID=A0A2V3IGZ5_9FLOR|nr:hypothetical protein BWQ96_08913 [Gracilariopsis chorda]|eukprot:PXF41365.1 hypothetical protein BWQ96_08913 [Gracilariopsis chorda]
MLGQDSELARVLMYVIQQRLVQAARACHAVFFVGVVTVGHSATRGHMQGGAVGGAVSWAQPVPVTGSGGDRNGGPRLLGRGAARVVVVGHASRVYKTHNMVGVRFSAA